MYKIYFSSAAIVEGAIETEPVLGAACMPLSDVTFTWLSFKVAWSFNVLWWRAAARAEAVGMATRGAVHTGAIKLPVVIYINGRK